MKDLLKLYDKEGVIREYHLLKLPLKGSVISKMSEQFYSEPDPCVIYSTAIINRFGMELSMKAEKLDLLNKKIPKCELMDILDHSVELADFEYGIIE